MSAIHSNRATFNHRQRCNACAHILLVMIFTAICGGLTAGAESAPPPSVAADVAGGVGSGDSHGHEESEDGHEHHGDTVQHLMPRPGGERNEKHAHGEEELKDGHDDCESQMYFKEFFQEPWRSAASDALMMRKGHLLLALDCAIIIALIASDLLRRRRARAYLSKKGVADEIEP